MTFLHCRKDSNLSETYHRAKCIPDCSTCESFLIFLTILKIILPRPLCMVAISVYYQNIQVEFKKKTHCFQIDCCLFCSVKKSMKDFKSLDLGHKAQFQKENLRSLIFNVSIPQKLLGDMQSNNSHRTLTISSYSILHRCTIKV